MAAHHSKLTPRQWAKAKEMYLGGQSLRGIGRNFGVSDTAISKGLGLNPKKEKELAARAFELQKEVEGLSKASQAKYASLLDNLRTASLIQGEKAKIDADTSIHLSRIANRHVRRVETENGEIDREQLSNVGALLSEGNKASECGLKLLTIGKEAMAGQSRKNRLEGMSLDELMAELEMKQAELEAVMAVSG